MSPRLQTIQNLLRDNKVDALFITNRYNLAYLTGFSGLTSDERECFFIVTKEASYLLTYPTYYGFYKKRSFNFQVRYITFDKSLKSHLQSIAKSHRLQKIGFERENVTVSEKESLLNQLEVDWVGVDSAIENLRQVKNEEELLHIRHAASVTDEAFDYIIRKIRKDVTEMELALDLEYLIKKKVGDIAFPPIVAFNENAAIPHYLPSNDQFTRRSLGEDGRLKSNSLILLDFGARVNGYCADMTRIVFFGQPSDHWVKVYETVLKAQELALSILRAGENGKRIDESARKIIDQAGYPTYPHGLGHGVGLAVHEAPRIRKDTDIILKENEVVTVEPAIYLEGDCGVRIEDLVVLKKGGVEILSKSPKELTII